MASAGRWLILTGFILALFGCSTPIADIGRAPQMSKVGSGAKTHLDAGVMFKGSGKKNGGLRLWDDHGGSLFRDSRARRVGDLVTVDISIDEKATLGNQSDRSKEAKVSNSLEYLIGILGLKNSGNGNLDVKSTSSSVGKGNVNRSEKIKFSIAAIVTRALTDGNLVISGSQEIRVNFELRVLKIQGIIRPRDISKSNRIPYDKIAEARVSYGGRGRIMEVQQPQLGHQLYDLTRPF